jgi:hypothetical protein
VVRRIHPFSLGNTQCFVWLRVLRSPRTKPWLLAWDLFCFGRPFTVHWNNIDVNMDKRFFYAQAEWCANKGLLSSFPHVNLLESRGLDPNEDSFPPSIWALHWIYLPCNTDQYNQVFLLSHFSVGSILGMGLPVLPWILSSGLAVRNKHRASVRAKGAARDLGGHFGTRKRR